MSSTLLAQLRRELDSVDPSIKLSGSAEQDLRRVIIAIENTGVDPEVSFLVAAEMMGRSLGELMFARCPLGVMPKDAVEILMQSRRELFQAVLMDDEFDDAWAVHWSTFAETYQGLVDGLSAEGGSIAS